MEVCKGGGMASCGGAKGGSPSKCHWNWYLWHWFWAAVAASLGNSPARQVFRPHLPQDQDLGLGCGAGVQRSVPNKPSGWF